MTAGSRPAERPRRRRPRVLWLVVLLVLAGAAWFGRDQLAELFSSARNQASDPEALTTRSADASSQAPGHPAGAAFDGFSNRYWAPAEPGGADGEYLDARFEEPVHLQRVIITPGRSVNRDEFLTQSRPAQITLTLTDADGDRMREEITLRDEPGPQIFEVSESDVVEVRLTIEAGYGEREGRRLAIAEVEFFGQR